MTTDTKDFGVRLRAMRTQAGLTQVELSEASGIRQSYISMLEAGERDNPTVETLRRLASALDTTTGYLADGEAAA